MRSEPIANYIWLGLHLRYLQDAREGYAVHGDARVLSNIEPVLTMLAGYGLQVTVRAADALIALKNELQATPLDSKLSDDQATRLSQVMRDLQRTLKAEANGIFAYVVTDKRLDARKLLGNPSQLFAPNVFDALPPIGRYDFIEAGYCVAFERATAAAFHVLRATEDVLRSYYCAIVRRNRVEPLLWGPMTVALAKRRRPPPLELLRDMDNIRLSFRNPTQHPDKVYDIQEAQDLFAHCIDVVNRMVRSTTWKGKGDA